MCSAIISQFDLLELSQKFTQKNVVHTLPSVPCSFPQAAMTNASLTETQATSCIPLLFRSAACCTKPGRWVWKQQEKYNVSRRKDECEQDTANRDKSVYPTLEQPGVKAPGTAKRTPFFPLKSWSIATLFPGSPSWTSTAGRCSPTCWALRRQCAGKQTYFLKLPYYLLIPYIKKVWTKLHSMHTMYRTDLWCKYSFMIWI